MPATVDTQSEAYATLVRRLEEMEARLEAFDQRMIKLEVVAAEIERIKELAGDLKFELEQMRE